MSSQISGYVNGLFVDFNSKVKKGELMATLILPTNYDVPAVKSAKGDLANAQANYELHKINLKRDKELLAKNLMAQSDYDTEDQRWSTRPQPRCRSRPLPSTLRQPTFPTARSGSPHRRLRH